MEDNKIKFVKCDPLAVLPAVYTDALSYYEDLNKLCYVVNELIAKYNILPDYIKDLIEQYLDSEHLIPILADMLSKFILNVKFPPAGINSAYGDGIHDDSVAIADCIKYASKNGCALYFPCGNYLTNSITMHDDVSLFGLDRYTTILTLKGGSNRPLISGMCSNLGLYNLTLNGNSINQTSNMDTVNLIGQNIQLANLIVENGYKLIEINGATGHLQLSNIVFKNAIYKCLEINGSSSTQIDNAYFESINRTYGDCIIDIGVNSADISFTSIARCSVCAKISGHNNNIQSSIINADRYFEDTGDGNSIYVSGSIIKENITDSKTITAKDIILNSANPLTYKSPTAINNSFSYIPMKTKTGDIYDVLVKNKNIYNQIGITIIDFGAVGDGVTDDTNAIKNAALSGMPVFFPSGTYLTGGQIQFASNTSFIGQNDSIIKLKDNANCGYIFLLDNVNNVSFINMEIDGNWKNNVVYGSKNSQNYETTLAYSPEFAIKINDCDRIIAKNCYLHDVWGSGIIADNSHNIMYDGNTIKNCRIVGLSIRYSSSLTKGHSDLSRIINNFVSGAIVGIHNIFGVYGIIITNNNVEKCKDSFAYPDFAYNGIYPSVYPKTGGYAQPETALTALLGDGAGIELTGGNTTGAANNEHITISENTVRYSQVGVRLEEQSTRCSVVGNICTYNDNYGIYLFSCNEITVQGNVCTHNNNNGISINKLNNNPSRRNTIANNICTLNKGFGIVLAGSTECSIIGNILRGNLPRTGDTVSGGIGLYEIINTGCLLNTISCNNISRDGDIYGIYSSSSNNVNNNIGSNCILGFGNNAISLVESTNMIHNNTTI